MTTVEVCWDKWITSNQMKHSLLTIDTYLDMNVSAFQEREVKKLLKVILEKDTNAGSTMLTYKQWRAFRSVFIHYSPGYALEVQRQQSKTAASRS